MRYASYLASIKTDIHIYCLGVVLPGVSELTIVTPCFMDKAYRGFRDDSQLNAVLVTQMIWAIISDQSIFFAKLCNAAFSIKSATIFREYISGK